MLQLNYSYQKTNLLKKGKKIVYRKTEIKVDKLCKIIKIINIHSFPCLLYDKLTVVNSWGVEIDLYLGWRSG